MSCTDCGKKGGCSTRKDDMFAAIDDVLARLYPDRRWGHRDEAAALDAGIGAEEGRQLAERVATQLGVATRFVPGGEDEWCDYVYILCLGRAPAIVDVREEHIAKAGSDFGPGRFDARWLADSVGDVPDQEFELDDSDTALDDHYLRMSLSSVARVVGVQEVSMRLRRQAEAIVITEQIRGGVFDPILLKRFQALVALLAETDLRHLDFGEIVEPPAGFDGDEFTARFGAPPAVANYLFSPRPIATRVTTVL